MHLNVKTDENLENRFGYCSLLRNKFKFHSLDKKTKRYVINYKKKLSSFLY